MPHRRAPLLLGAVLAVALLLPQAALAAGQVPVQMPAPPAPAPAPAPPAPAAAGPSLTQGVWLWTRTELSDGAVLRSPNPNAYTLAFNPDGRVAIRADCNTGSAAYTVDGSQLTIEPGIMTLAACPPGSQDTRFVQDLSQVASFVFSGPQLVLNMRFDSGNMYFSPQSPTGLSGPTWRVTSINNGNDAVVSTVPGTQVSMLFGEDGTVSGSGGCNNFSGSYTLSGSSISFGPLASTLRACFPVEVSEQEQYFYAALSATTTYELNGDRLTFRDDAGATQVIAVRPTVQPPR